MLRGRQRRAHRHEPRAPARPRSSSRWTRPHELADSEWAATLGIKELVAEATTNYPRGQPRVVNIKRISELTPRRDHRARRDVLGERLRRSAHRREGLRRGRLDPERRLRGQRRRRHLAVRHDAVQRGLLRRARLRRVPEPLDLHQPLPLRARGDGVVPEARPADHEHDAVRRCSSGRSRPTPASP